MPRSWQPDGATHSGAAEAAVAAGVLREILLVIVLGVKQRRRRADLGRAARVTDRGRPHTWHLPELAFGAPEATHPEHRALQAFGKRRLDGMTVDEVRDSHTPSIRRAVRWVTLSHGGAPRHLRQHSQ